MRRRSGVGEGELGVVREGQPNLSRGASSVLAGARSATLGIESISPFAWCAGTRPELPQRGAWGGAERHRASAFPTPGSLRRGLRLLGRIRALVVVRALVTSAMGRGVVRAFTCFFTMVLGALHAAAAAFAAA